METVLRVLTGVLGLFFLWSAAQWFFSPVTAAQGLMMELLENPGLNSQLGDFTAFFFTLSFCLLFGAWRRRPDFLIAGGLLLGSAAVFRLTAGQFHDATVFTQAVIFEVIGAAIIFATARKMQIDGDDIA